MRGLLPATEPAPTGQAVAGAPAVVRVIVVTYSPGETLELFLDTLASATSQPYEVVLADNGSDDGSLPPALRRPEVRLVETGSNIGYGAAANVGAKDADARWLVVANPDVVWEPGSLDALLRAGERWPHAGALGPAIRTVGGELYPSARNLPSLGRGMGHALLGWWWASNPWTKAYRRERGEPVEGPCGWLSGSCLLLRREAFEDVGGFDPAYFMYFEDVDLGERLGRRGWTSVYVPSSVVLHTGGHATARNPKAMLRAHHASAYRYLARRYGGAHNALLRVALRLGLGVRYVLSLGSRRIAEGAAPTRSADVLET